MKFIVENKFKRLGITTSFLILIDKIPKNVVIVIVNLVSTRKEK